MNNEQKSLDLLIHQNDVGFMELIKRLKDHRLKTHVDEDLKCDLLIAAQLINYIAMSRDDYK